MNSPKLSIYIVDDDEAIRRSLVMLLHPLGFPMQTFESGENFLAVADALEAGCVVLDLRMRVTTGVQVFDALIRRRSGLTVVFLSGHGDIQTAISQVKRGAISWIEKPIFGEALQEAIREGLARAEERASAKARWFRLTLREREVVPLLAAGWSNKEIARRMQPECGPRAIETYRANIYGKLEIDNAADVRGWATQHAWLTDFA